MKMRNMKNENEKHFLGGLMLLLTLFNLSTENEVSSPPYIVKQPPTRELFFKATSSGEADKPLIIPCEATGEPNPSYRWTVNGMELTIDDKRMEQQSGRGTFAILKPSEADVGDYICFAENIHGTARSNLALVRKAELKTPENTEVLPVTGFEGQPLNLTCQKSQSWPEPEFNWVYLTSQGSFGSINNSRITTDPEGNLLFANLQKVDEEHVFACVARSHVLYEYKIGNKVQLSVVSNNVSSQEPVLQYISDENMVAVKGKRTELFCIFGGTPLPKTVWLTNGKVVQWTDRTWTGNYGKSLIIKNVDFADEGVYTCQVSNEIGEPKTHSMNLTVLAAPYFTKEPEIVTASVGETAEIDCEAAGVPHPEIEWFHNGKPISEAPNNARRKVEANKIVIEGLVKEDTSNYGCNAKNHLGYVYKDVYVNVKDWEPENEKGNNT